MLTLCSENREIAPLSDPTAGQALTNQIQLIERSIANCYRAGTRIGVGVDSNRQAQELLQVALHCGYVSRRRRITFAAGAARRLFAGCLPERAG